jgi:hypothetical protein
MMDQVRAVLSPDEPDYARVRTLGPGALPVLAELVQGTDAMLGSKAAYAAGVIGGADAIGVLECAAASPAPAVRVAAAAAVGELGLEFGGPLLVQMLEDADTGVRRFALRSAVGRQDPVLRSRIHALSTSDPDIQLRAEATRVAAVGKAGGVRAPRLTAASVTRTDRRARASRMRAAARAARASISRLARTQGCAVVVRNDCLKMSGAALVAFSVLDFPANRREIHALGDCRRSRGRSVPLLP